MTVTLGVLLSGSGTTLQNFLDRIADGRLDAEVRCVISTRPGVKGLERAESAGIPAYVVSRKKHKDLGVFSSAVTEILDEHRPDLVTLAGFLSLWRIPAHYEGRVLNIHPALIPLFCGKGYYGMRVHEAVVASGVKFSGCTVHFADNEYDNGPIVIQRTVPVHFEDSAEDVQHRVFAEECEAYPDAIRLYGEGRLRIVGNRVEVR
jgi:formyltetrahydrofolate-dependent phosphoribosylglycinamide formyltransferase